MRIYKPYNSTWGETETLLFKANRGMRALSVICASIKYTATASYLEDASKPLNITHGHKDAIRREESNKSTLADIIDFDQTH